MQGHGLHHEILDNKVRILPQRKGYTKALNAVNMSLQVLLCVCACVRVFIK